MTYERRPFHEEIKFFLQSENAVQLQRYQIRLGQFETEANWQNKANSLKVFQDSLGFKVLSITTNDSNDVYDEAEFFYSWFSALMYGHEATSWGEFLFSANDALAPFRARPAVDSGMFFTGDIINTSPLFTRNTNLGTIFVNTSTHEVGFNQAIPEPSTWILLGIGVLGLFGYSRRRCRKR